MMNISLSGMKSLFKPGPFGSSKIIPLWLGSLTGLVGILVLWGWHTHNVAVIQIHPNFREMHYNTALCLLAGGVALVAICKTCRLLPFLLGILVLSVGCLTLTEYIFTINIGLDQLFMRAYLPTQSSYPGRMSPNGALALSLIGASLLLLSYPLPKISGKGLLSVVMIVSLISLMLSWVAIFGYITTLPGTYGWRSYVEMAPHTACTVTLLSIGIIFMAKIKASENYISFSSWSPLFVFIAFAVMTLLFWDASWTYVAKNEQKKNEMAAVSIKNALDEDLKSRREALARMVSRWKIRQGGTPYKEWSQDALNLIDHQPGYQAIEWVDPDYHIRWIAPLEGNEAALNFNTAQDGKFLPALRLAIEKNMIAITPVLTLKTGNQGFLLCAPIMGEEKIDGAIVGVIDSRLFFEEIFSKEIPEYNIAIYADNQLIYQRGTLRASPVSYNRTTVVAEEPGWSITVWAKPELLEKQHSWLPLTILFVGFLAALLFSLIAYLAQVAKNSATSARREIDLRKKTEHQLIVYSEKLKKLSLLDSLTGINNRRSLSHILEKEITHLRDKGISFSVLLLDIDHFKKINDTYGHVMGDQVLQKVGSILRKNMRATDTVARYGGEEFCIVLPDTTDKQALAIAERLRLLIADMRFYCGKREPFHITGSIGVYQVSSHLKKVQDVFKAVDSALYKAKNSGRNCVIMEQYPS